MAFDAFKLCDFAFQNSHFQNAYNQIGGGAFYKRGHLFKRLRQYNRYAERLFELSEKDNYLRYYVKDLPAVEQQNQRSSNSSLCKASISLDKLNATFLCGAGPNKRTILQILFPSK